ncbi:MAG: hypothetical protein NW237_10825 [Cyanobacteriota bacterium]|nr:hypothetical protein [Cyanobacteriota bacterium]
MQLENTSEARIVEASPEELTSWEKYKTETQIKSIPIPYAFVSVGVNAAGIFYLEDPVENSSTEGAAVGAIIGAYRLDKNKTDVKLHDLSEYRLHLDIVLIFVERVLKARICNHRWNGSWKSSDYTTLVSWQT